MMNYQSSIFRISFLLTISSYIIWCVSTPESWSLIDNIDLIIHEAGHMIVPTFLFGQFINILAGSLAQVVVPIVFSVYFLIREDFFSSGIVLLWVGQSFANLSVYIGDAISQSLPLIGGEDVIHDWNYLLSNFGMLSYATNISAFAYFLSVLFVLLGIGVSVYSIQKRQVV